MRLPSVGPLVALLSFFLLPASGADNASLKQGIVATAGSPKFKEWLVHHRRELHQIPELGFEENATSAYVRKVLDELGIQYRYPVATYGIVAEIGSKEGPLIGLRADMDGLPIQEPNTLPFHSQHPGRMHACGHDAHTSMLLGAARLLKEAEDRLPGRVRLLFQPGEEGMGGARIMVQEGAIEGLQALFGMHVWPGAPSGTIGTRPGTLMAASDRFEAEIKGRGGHAAIPHAAIDPVVAASAAVMGLQPLVSRETSPTDSTVVSVTRFNTGEGGLNVIPASAKLGGSIRATTVKSFERIRKRVTEVLTSTAATHGCTIQKVTWSDTPYPPTINDPTAAALVADVAHEIGKMTEAAAAATDKEAGWQLPETQFRMEESPILAAEDFSFYGEHVPACFMFVGTGSAPGTNVMVHNPSFQMDESQLPVGSVLHATLAVEALTRLGAGGSLAPAAAAGKAGQGTCSSTTEL